MESAGAWVRRAWERVRDSNTVAPLVFALVVGAGAGGAALLFRRLIDGMRVVFFDGLGTGFQLLVGPLYPILVLALGGLIVGLATRYLTVASGGQGVSEILLAVTYRGGRMPPVSTVVKALMAAVTIGSGGSAGREGPTLQIGAAIGSALSHLFRLPDRQGTLLAGCGVAAGIAATFNAPIAGVMFALEIVLARFTSSTFTLVVISSTTGTVVSRWLQGDNPAFDIPVKYSLASFGELLLFALLGMLAALAGQAFTQALYSVERAGEKLHIPPVLKPAVGGAFVGLIGIGVPGVFGNGFDEIGDALTGRLPVEPLLIFCAAKIAATALTVGSGGSGGVFTPTLLIGATLGGAFGDAANKLFFGQVSEPGAFALVGMAAVFASAGQAPITAVFLVFELTDDYQLILPLMIASVLSAYLSRRLSRDSMYTIKLLRRGYAVGEPQEVNLMDALTVRDAMTVQFDSVPPDMPVSQLMTRFATGETGFPVIGPDKRLFGIVTSSDVAKVVDKHPDQLTVKDICTRNVLIALPDQTLSHALSRFGSCNIGRMPVVDPYDHGRVLGMLNRAGVVAAYAEAHNRSVGILEAGSEFHERSRRNESVLLEEVLRFGGRLGGRSVREARFPAHSTLVTIRRAESVIIPNGATVLHPGDTVVVLTTRRNADQVKRWLQEHC